MLILDSRGADSWSPVISVACDNPVRGVDILTSIPIDRTDAVRRDAHPPQLQLLLVAPHLPVACQTITPSETRLRLTHSGVSLDLNKSDFENSVPSKS